MSVASHPPLGVDHKAYIKSLADTDKLSAWKSYTDAFWNTDPLGGNAKAEFLFRRGFLRDKWVLYDLERQDSESYVSDFQAAEIRRANGIYANVLDDRMLLIHTLAGYCEVPRIHAMRGLDADEVSLTPEWAAHRAGRSAPDLDVHILPLLSGLQGRMETAALKSGEFSGFGKDGSIHRLSNIVKDWSLAARVPYLFTDAFEQGAFMSGLNAGSRNGLSVILARDLTNWEPLVVSAILRFGSKRSGGSLSMAAGGLSAPVDLQTGAVGPAAFLDAKNRMQRLKKHPDTGARIAGLDVPGWAGIRATLQRIIDESSYMRVAMLDFTLLHDGTLALLGPSSTEMAPFQVHEPLLNTPAFADVLRKLAL